VCVLVKGVLSALVLAKIKQRAEVVKPLFVDAAHPPTEVARRERHAVHRVQHPRRERVSGAQIGLWPPSDSVHPRHFLLHRKQHPSRREAVGCLQPQRSRGRGLGKQLPAPTWSRVVASRLPPTAGVRTRVAATEQG
jgi:hypothetical protein